MRRRAPLRRSGPLRRQSAKAEEVARERTRLRLRLRVERGHVCEVCKARPWSDMHEILPRSGGGDPLDPSNILLVCGPGNVSGCHGWIHQNPREAMALGYLRSRHTGEAYDDDGE